MTNKKTCLSMNDADLAVDIVEGVLEETQTEVQRSNHPIDAFERTLGWGNLSKDQVLTVVGELTENKVPFINEGSTIALTVPAEWNAAEMYTW